MNQTPLELDGRECATLVRNAKAQAFRDILNGVYGEVPDDVKRECEEFLRQHDAKRVPA